MVFQAKFENVFSKYTKSCTSIINYRLSELSGTDICLTKPSCNNVRGVAILINIAISVINKN